MYPRTPREDVADLLGSTEPTLGINEVADRIDPVYMA